jgi:hypothetical protein
MRSATRCSAAPPSTSPCGSATPESATWFAVYVVIIAIVGFVAVLFMHDNRKHSTIDNADSSAYKRIGQLIRRL